MSQTPIKINGSEPELEIIEVTGYSAATGVNFDGGSANTVYGPEDAIINGGSA
jgi:hypothetical protein